MSLELDMGNKFNEDLGKEIKKFNDLANTMGVDTGMQSSILLVGLTNMLARVAVVSSMELGIPLRSVMAHVQKQLLEIVETAKEELEEKIKEDPSLFQRPSS